MKDEDDDEMRREVEESAKEEDEDCGERGGRSEGNKEALRERSDVGGKHSKELRKTPILSFFFYRSERCVPVES